MLTREDDVDVHALRRRGWTISAIARHIGRDRKTVRAYLNGDRVAGRARRGRAGSVRAVRRLRAAHGWSRTRTCGRTHPVRRAASSSGSTASYPTLHPAASGPASCARRASRAAPAKDRPNAVIEHPPGEETQWDWLELPDPPEHVGVGHRWRILLVGSLAHSGRWRGGAVAESTDQPHLVDGLRPGLPRAGRGDPGVAVRPDGHGLPPRHRAGSPPRSPAVAKHYGVSVAICPPRRGNRKGVVEKANHTAAQRWWRTLADDVTVEQAQASLDRFCARARRHPDARHRRRPRPPWPPSPRANRCGRCRRRRSGDPHRDPDRVARRRWSSFRGNRYSVPPELAARPGHRVASRLGARDHRHRHQRAGS